MTRVLSAISILLFYGLHPTTGQTTSLFGSLTDIPRWCGKAYMQGSPNFDPGGQFQVPKPSPSLRLDLRIVSRHSVYDSSESTAAFIVDCILSNVNGEPYRHDSESHGSTDFDIDIRLQLTNQSLASRSLSINTTDNLVAFDIRKLRPRLKPYPITLTASLARSHPPQTFTATTELYYLPAKRNGSTVKVDRLSGGLLVANHKTNYAFSPLLPFGFYGSCSDYLNISQSNIKMYAAEGFNSVNPVCAFPDGDLTDMFDWLDQDNIWYQYDMRGSYQNIRLLRSQVPLVKDRSNLLMWYTADEPDGWSYLPNTTTRAYDVLRDLDPYHPTALVMNCRDYYFREYSAGADVIMEDVYPVGINTTYSRRWHTPVNETFGDAGCDDCRGLLTDVSDRLDEYSAFQQALGKSAQRQPLWAVVQAFSGGDYWSRDPTAEETFVMAVLAINHGAKGILSWLFPTSPALLKAHGQLARVFTSTRTSPFLLRSNPIAVPTSHKSLLDTAYWVLEDRIMISIANLESHNSTKRQFKIHVPVSVSRIDRQEWGSTRWTLKDNWLSASSIAGLATDFLILRRTDGARLELREGLGSDHRVHA